MTSFLAPVTVVFLVTVFYQANLGKETGSQTTGPPSHYGRPPTLPSSSSGGLGSPPDGQPPAPPSSSSGGPGFPPGGQPPAPPSSASGGLGSPPGGQPPTPTSSASGGLGSPPGEKLPVPTSSSQGGLGPPPGGQPPSPPGGQPPVPTSSPPGGLGSPPGWQPPAPTSSASGGLGSPARPGKVGTSTTSRGGLRHTQTTVSSVWTSSSSPQPTRLYISNFLLSSLQRKCSPDMVPTDDSVGPNWDKDINRLLHRIFSSGNSIKLYSCENRCGLSQRYATVWQTRAEYKCYCDSLCDDFGDCCYDFGAMCRQTVTTHSLPQSSYESCRAVDLGRSIEAKYNGFVVWTACPVNWKDESVRQKCQDAYEDQSDFLRNLPVFDKNNNRTYRNIFCASCNGAENTTYWQLTLTCKKAFSVKNLNFINILDFLKKNCSAKISPDDYQRQNSKMCIPRYQDCSNVTQTKNESYCQKECLRYAFPVCSSSKTIFRFRNIQCALCNGLTPKDLDGTCNFKSAPDSPPLTILFDFQSTSSYKIQVYDMTGSAIKRFDKRISCQVDEVYDPYLRKCQKLTSSVPLHGNITDLMKNCTFISFNQTDYVLFSNNSVYLRPYNKIYDNTTYAIHGNSLLLCVNFSRNATITEKERNDIEITATLASLQLLTSIGCIVSTVSLVLLLMTYIFFPELRNLPGKIVINLASSLLLYQVVFFLAGDTSDKVRCMAVAVLLHFFALSSFAWMNVMAFDIHHTFTAAGDIPRTQGGQRKRLMKYSLYSWVTPAFVVVICLVVDHAEDGSIGYGLGKDNCFISRPQALVYSFVLPVALLMLFNLFALGHTLIHIVKTRKAAQRVTNQRPGSSITMICVKMVSVMGVTWLLGVAANFKALSFLWYPFVVLNSLQGAFIFLSFAVSGRALELYKSKLTKVLRVTRETSESIVHLPSTSEANSKGETHDTQL